MLRCFSLIFEGFHDPRRLSWVSELFLEDVHLGAVISHPLGRISRGVACDWGDLTPFRRTSTANEMMITAISWKAESIM